MSTNRAVWQDNVGVALSIRPTAYHTKLESDQILVKAHAWAINPCDHMIQDIAFPFVTYPVVLGEDIAGTVVSAGTAASSRFKPKDRVLAMSSGLKNPSCGAFQEFVVVDGSLACHIPQSMSFAEASVFPLTTCTPSYGLFSKEYLGLQKPQIEPIKTGKSVLVWGGASSVGSNAIQLAKAVGYDVFATSSMKNFEYIKALGATKVFDYSTSIIIADIVSSLNQTNCAGMFQAAGSIEPCLEIAQQAEGQISIASATRIPEGKDLHGVKAKMVFGDLSADAELKEAIFFEISARSTQIGEI